jgi:choline-glycine betaine transporter
MSTVSRIGFWSSITAFAMAAGYSVVQILQMLGLLTFPWDEILIFGFSIGIPVPFVLAMIALHHSVSGERRVWTHCAVILAAMYAVLVTIVYPTQLALVVVIDGAGYLLMGLATLFAAGAFRDDPSRKWLRRFLIANGLIDPVILAVYIFPWLLPAGGLWVITAPGSMWLLARHFRS